MGIKTTHVRYYLGAYSQGVTLGIRQFRKRAKPQCIPLSLGFRSPIVPTTANQLEPTMMSHWGSCVIRLFYCGAFHIDMQNSRASTMGTLGWLYGNQLRSRANSGKEKKHMAATFTYLPRHKDKTESRHGPHSKTCKPQQHTLQSLHRCPVLTLPSLRRVSHTLILTLKCTGRLCLAPECLGLHGFL